MITPKEGLNYEVPKDNDRNNIYVFTLTVTDSFGKTDTARVSVTVVNVAETLTAPQDVAEASTGMEVEENSPLKHEYRRCASSLPTPATALTRLTRCSAGPASADPQESASFRIHRDNGQIYVNAGVELRGSANAMRTDSDCNVRVRITGLEDR